MIGPIENAGAAEGPAMGPCRPRFVIPVTVLNMPWGMEVEGVAARAFGIAMDGVQTSVLYRPTVRIKLTYSGSSDHGRCYPVFGTMSCFVPPFDDERWRGCLASIVAHEARHLWQYITYKGRRAADPKAWRYSEVDARQAANRASQEIAGSVWLAPWEERRFERVALLAGVRKRKGAGS